MSKQRVPGDDLLFSQSELAELDAELAPQPVDEAEAASARTPPQQTPITFDELVDNAFADEETAEKQLVIDPEATVDSGFDGFVEAEPANTDEIMAVLAERAPISSAPLPPMRITGVGKSLSELQAAGAMQPSNGVPSVIIDDSPFADAHEASPAEAGAMVPQLAELAAAMDTQQRGTVPVADTVLSSSPPPSEDGVQVAVGNAGGGSVPSRQAPALATLSQAVTGATGEHPIISIEMNDSGEQSALPEASVSPSAGTPVVALDDQDFHVLDDSEERPSEPPEAELPLPTEESAESAEAPAEAAEAPADATEGIDAAWSEAAEAVEAPMPGSTQEDLSPIDAAGFLHDSPAEREAEPEAEAEAVAEAETEAEAVSESEAVAETEPEAEAEIPLHSQVTPVRPPGSSYDQDLSPVAPSSEAEVFVGGAQSGSSPPSPDAQVSQTTPSREGPPPPIPRDAATRRTIPSVSSLPPPPPPPLPPAASKAPPPPPKAVGAPPPLPPPAYRAAPPPMAPLPAAPPPPAPNFGDETKLRKKRRSKQWFEEIFDEDYLHTLPFMTPQQTEREVAFLLEALELPSSGRVLDIGCGYGRHAMELAARGYRTVGLDLSLPLLIRATDAARRVGVNVDFVHGDMRDMSFDAEFDAAYCFFTTFGYFDDDTNRKVAAGICRALKPGGRFVLELLNRDYLIGDLPTRVWWQGDGCVLLEEVDFNYFTSRLQVQRQIILEDGRQLEQDISIRAYSLHEIGKVLHHAGFRVLEVSGNLGLRGRFYGNESRQLIVVAEKRADAQ